MAISGKTTSDRLATRETVQELIKGARAYLYDDQLMSSSFVASGTADMFALSFTSTLYYGNSTNGSSTTMSISYPAAAANIRPASQVNEKGPYGEGMKVNTYIRTINHKLQSTLNNGNINGLMINHRGGITGTYTNITNTYDSRQHVYMLATTNKDTASGVRMHKYLTESNIMLLRYYLGDRGYYWNSTAYTTDASGPYFVSGSKTFGFENFSSAKVIRIIRNSYPGQGSTFSHCILRGTIFTHDKLSGLYQYDSETGDVGTTIIGMDPTVILPTGPISINDDWQIKHKISMTLKYASRSYTEGTYTYKPNSLGVSGGIRYFGVVHQSATYPVRTLNFSDNSIDYTNGFNDARTLLMAGNSMWPSTNKAVCDVHEYISLYFKGILMTTFDIYTCGAISGPSVSTVSTLCMNPSITYDLAQLKPIYDHTTPIFINFYYTPTSQTINYSFKTGVSNKYYNAIPSTLTSSGYINNHLRFDLEFNYTDANGSLNVIKGTGLKMTTDLSHDMGAITGINLTPIISEYNSNVSGTLAMDVYVNCTFTESSYAYAYSYGYGGGGLEIMNERTLVWYDGSSAPYYIYLCQEDCRVVNLDFLSSGF